MVKQFAAKAIQVVVLLSAMWLLRSARTRVDDSGSKAMLSNERHREGMDLRIRGNTSKLSDGIPHLDLGSNGEALIPALVVPRGSRYEFTNKEKRSFFNFNDYSWILKNNCSGKDCHGKEMTLMKARGGWTSNAFGRRLVKVSDEAGNRLFDFRMNRYRWNPFQLRSVFRVFPPDVTDLDQTLFTINRDIFGKGIFWVRWEWRVYQGRKREAKPLYYALESYTSGLGRAFTQTGKYKIYQSQEDQEAEAPPVATLAKKMSVLGILGKHYGAGDLLPDKYTITIEEGQDSAILLVLSSIIDMVSDLVQDSKRK